MTIRLAHLSDLHLGYEAYAARSPLGHNQRGEDVVRALHRVVSDIVAADPPLVICSGDVAELPQIPVRYMLAAASEFQRLASLRPDGTRRQLVVIAGNHDQSRHVRDGCFLDLYRGLPGVSVVTNGYQRLTFDETELAGVVVHALPHDALRDLPELGVTPVPGAINILTAHGVAESSELYRRAVGREYLIPAELLLMEWAYVALGHWHTQGPVFPLGITREHSRIWYAGSVESIDFADVRGGTVTERGWLLVEASPDGDPTVMPQRHPVRTLTNLPVIDATGLSPDQLQAQMSAALTPEISGAVVRQRVTGVSRDLWALVDTPKLYEAARDALFYRIEPVFFAEFAQEGDQPRGLARIGGLLTEHITKIVPEADRPAVLALTHELLRQVAVEVAPAEPDDLVETPGSEVVTALPEAVVQESPLQTDARPEAVVPEKEVPAEASQGENDIVPGPLSTEAHAAALATLLGEFNGISIGPEEDPT